MILTCKGSKKGITTHSATMVTKVKNFLDKLNPVPFLSKIEQEIRDNERSKLQQEVNRISLALDEYLRNHIKGYHASHNKVYKNFNFVYRSAHGLKKELQIYLNDWISANCDHLFDCFVDINVKPEYGFHHHCSSPLRFYLLTICGTYELLFVPTLPAYIS